MKTKKDKTYSFNHFKERLKERYNLNITMDEYNILCLASLVEIPITTEQQKNDTQKIYDIKFKNTTIRVVYSESRRLLTTVLSKEHHIWCNYYILPVEKCKSCKRLNKLYPMNGLIPDELMEKHFPDAIKVIKGE